MSAEDFARLHTRLDAIHDTVSDTRVRVGVLENKVQTLSEKVDAVRQPCDQMTRHLAEHADERKTFRQIAAELVPPALVAAATAVALKMGWK